jgi:hypothetical protein
MTTISTISELNYTACGLAPSGVGLPLPGLPADLATDLLAKLWSGGTLAACDHPLGNNIEFHGSKSNPNDLGLPWRDYISCQTRNVMFWSSPATILGSGFGKKKSDNRWLLISMAE